MINFEDVITSLRTTMPTLERDWSAVFVLKDKPHYRIKISRPDPFDNYLDVVAKVALCYKDKPMWCVLITIDTDIKKFCTKLMNKIKQGV